MQDFMTASEAAEKWGITPRQVQNLCKKGQIKNAKKFGKSWSIPVDTQRPQYKFVCETKTE